jgi:hypothetical protein
MSQIWYQNLFLKENSVTRFFYFSWRHIKLCIFNYKNIHKHTYNSRFIPEGVAEASQIFLGCAYVLPKRLSYEEYCRCDSWQAHRRLIAVYLRWGCSLSFSRLLRHPWKKEKGVILLFCPGHHTRQSKVYCIIIN